MRTSQVVGMIDTSLFPYETFPIRLQFGEKKELTICWFRDTVDLQKYLDRYKLDKRKVKIDCRDGESTEFSKEHKKKVRSTTPKINSGSTSGGRRSTKKLDSSGTSNSTRKPKPKPKPKSESKPKRKPKSK